jgi:hypothetical protein
MENGLFLEYMPPKTAGKRIRKKSGSEVRKPKKPVKSRLPGFTKFPLITV